MRLKIFDQCHLSSTVRKINFYRNLEPVQFYEEITKALLGSGPNEALHLMKRFGSYCRFGVHTSVRIRTREQ